MTLVRFTPEVAADLAERVGEIYGLRLEVTMVIEGETDASIGMRAPDGDGYLVKARPDRMDSPDLIWQEQVHVRLAQHRFPFDVPRLIASRSGELRVELEVEGIPHIVRVLTFLEGELMSNVNVVPGADFLTDLGAVSARLTQALADLKNVTWSYPAAYAALAACTGVEKETALVAYLWSWVENQVLAAMKTVPLGQIEGQQLLHRLKQDIAKACLIAQSTSTAEAGSAPFGLALASTRHETQYSRLFRS